VLGLGRDVTYVSGDTPGYNYRTLCCLQVPNDIYGQDDVIVGGMQISNSTHYVFRAQYHHQHHSSTQLGLLTEHEPFVSSQNREEWHYPLSHHSTTKINGY